MDPVDVQPVDAQSAKSDLEALKQTMKAFLVGVSAEIDAIEVAQSILDGTITIQSNQLEDKYKAQIESLNIEINEGQKQILVLINDKVALQARIDVLDPPVIPPKA